MISPESRPLEIKDAFPVVGLQERRDGACGESMGPGAGHAGSGSGFDGFMIALPLDAEPPPRPQPKRQVPDDTEAMQDEALYNWLYVKARLRYT